jgi:hypothetical protein
MITAEIDRYGERDYSRKRAGKPSLEYYLLSTWVSVASQDNHFTHHRRRVVATPKCKHARLVGDEGDSGEFATLDGEIDVIALDDGVMHCAIDANYFKRDLVALTDDDLARFPTVRRHLPPTVFSRRL